MRFWPAIVAFSIAASAAPATAHHGPNHDIERLTRLLQTEPGRADWLLARAQAYRIDGQPGKAIEDLDQAARLNGDASQLSLERGLSLSALQRDTDADVELTRHLSGPHPTASGYAERAAIRERCGRKTDAIDDLTAAINLVPKIDWYLVRGRMQESLGRLDDATEGFRGGLARCDGAVALRLELLRLETSRGRFDVAIGLIDEALPQARIKTEWYLRRADVQDAAGRPQAARADRVRALAEAERAIGLRPTAQRLLLRAKAYLALDQREKATLDLQAALKKAPSLTEAEEMLARLEPAKHVSGAAAP